MLNSNTSYISGITEDDKPASLKAQEDATGKAIADALAAETATETPSETTSETPSDTPAPTPATPAAPVPTPAVIKMDIESLSLPDRKEFYKNYLMYCFVGDEIDIPFAGRRTTSSGG